MCKRDTTDPLVRLFLDKYRLHLLAQPREDVAVGDVYPHYGGATYQPGRYDALLPPPFKLPKARSGEKAADVSGTASSAVSAKAGLGILESFLTAIGAGGVVEKVKVSLESKGARNLKFRFGKPTRDYIDPLQLEVALREYKVEKQKSLFDAERRYFITTGVMRSKGLAITALDESDKAVNVEIEALRAASATAGVKLEADSRSQITFSGSKPLAFGVELHEIVYDPARRRSPLSLKGTSQAVTLRAAGDREPPSAPQASFIGDAAAGDVFLAIRKEA